MLLGSDKGKCSAKLLPDNCLLYKCLTSHPDYLNDNWDTDYYDGYGTRSRMRLTSCSACFNAHGDNKDDYKRCMDEQSVCFRDNSQDSGPNCDLTYNYA